MVRYHCPDCQTGEVVGRWVRSYLDQLSELIPVWNGDHAAYFEYADLPLRTYWCPECEMGWRGERCELCTEKCPPIRQFEIYRSPRGYDRPLGYVAAELGGGDPYGAVGREDAPAFVAWGLECRNRNVVITSNCVAHFD